VSIEAVTECLVVYFSQVFDSQMEQGSDILVGAGYERETAVLVQIKVCQPQNYVDHGAAFRLITLAYHLRKRPLPQCRRVFLPKDSDISDFGRHLHQTLYFLRRKEGPSSPVAEQEPQHLLEAAE